MKSIYLALAVLAMTTTATGCSNPSDDDAANETINAAMQAAANADAAIARADAALAMAEGRVTSPTVSSSDLARICRAAVAHMMGKDPAIMKVKSNSDGVVRIQYKRPDDGTIWKDDCRLEGQRVMWRAVDAFAGSGPGRWRNHPDDEVITYSLDGDNVTINQRYSDGSNDSATFVVRG